MSKRIRIYLDTSVINFLFAEDAPENRDATIDLFDNFIKTGIYETYISDFVIDEIEQTTNQEKRKKLLDVTLKYSLEFVELNNEKEIQELAQQYLEAKIIPEKKYMDALHVAVAVTKQIP